MDVSVSRSPIFTVAPRGRYDTHKILYGFIILATQSPLVDNLQIDMKK